MRSSAVVGLVALAAVAVSVPALASPPAISCPDRTMEVVNKAKTIVVAKPKSIATSTKDTTFTVRVTYTVDQALLGTKTPEVVVEESCDTGSAKLEEMGYPSVERYCNNGSHAFPGLTPDGSIGPSPVALLLADAKSDVDGSAVMKMVKPFKWGPCADDAAMVKARPALKDLVTKVKATNEKATEGFPAPRPQPAGSASASASASGSASGSGAPPPSATTSSSAMPASTGSSTPAPSTSSVPAPQKSGGCSSCSVTDGSTGIASAWPLVGLVLISLRRRLASRALLRSR